MEFFHFGSLEEVVIRYGYLALFVGTFLEGETILLIAGYLAHTGHLDLLWVILAAFLGSFSGDQTFFFLGRWKGLAFLARHPAWQQKAARAFALLSRFQVPVILGFRFLYGIRNVTPFVIGASGLRPRRFFVLNLLGALTWAIAFGCVGYNVGSVVESVLQRVAEYEQISLMVFCALALVYLLWPGRRKR